MKSLDTEAQVIVHEDNLKLKLALAASNFDGVDVLSKSGPPLQS